MSPLAIGLMALGAVALAFALLVAVGVIGIRVIRVDTSEPDWEGRGEP